MIRRLRDYYRQFEALSPEEMSRELLDRRDAERARLPVEVPALDLASAAWHEPPHPEAVNAATYALRRSVNAYPDATPLRDAIAGRHGLERAQVAVGHGAGELLRAALGHVGGGDVAVAWPGWGPLPRLVHEAGAMAVPVALAADGAADVEALAASGAAAVVVCTPNDPTGAALSPQALHELASRVPEAAWLIVDAALAEFEDPRGTAEPTAAGDDPRGAAEPGAAGDDPRGAAEPAAAGDDPRGAAEPAAAGDDPRGAAEPAAAGDDPRGAAEPGAAGDDPGSGALARLVGARERVVVVRSFSKAHGMAGFRAGWAVTGDAALAERLAPVGGLSAAAVAAATWAVGAGVAPRRRALVAAERERLRAAGYEFAAGPAHLVWLPAPDGDGRALAAHLAARRIYVTPGAAWGDDRHVRIALRDRPATERLIAALSEL